MTTTTKRPTLAKKHTRSMDDKRHALLNQGLRLQVDGTVYEVSAGDLNALDIKALRDQTGMTFGALMRATLTDFDIDILAAVMWLSRRVAGERSLTYEDVAGEVGYDDLTKIELPGDDDEDGDEPDDDAAKVDAQLGE